MSPLNQSAQAGMGSGVEGREEQGASFGPDHPAQPEPASGLGPSGGCSSRGSADILGILSDPIAVHINMLRGTIARPSVESIIHLYGKDALLTALAPAIEARRADMRSISVEFYQHDWLPGFAAFRPGATAPDGRAFCVVNLGALLSAVESGDLPAGDLPYVIADSMMHEVIHAIEQWAGVEFSEERVEALLAKYRDAASAGEAGTAETGTDSVHEHAAPSGETPSQSPDPLSQTVAPSTEEKE